MKLPTAEQLGACTVDELRVLIGELLAVIAQQQAEIVQLKAEIARLKQPPSSHSSSQPPSRDQKANVKIQRRKKYGPPKGHPRQTRPLVDKPDHVIAAPVSACTHCAQDLSKITPAETRRRQVTELPVIKPVIFETQQAVVVCPHCRTQNVGMLPPELPDGRYFGPQLVATVVYLKQPQHLSYQRIVETMHTLYQVELSEGVIAALLRRAGEAAQDAATAIKEQVRQSPVIQSDETSARVGGRTWWHWIFRSTAGVFHQITPRRNAAVVADFMQGAVAEVWVSDCGGAQLCAPTSARQICLSHQIRALERVVELQPKHLWARNVQQLFRSAIHLRNRLLSDHPTLTLPGYWRRVAYFHNELDRLLAQFVTGELAQQLQARFLRHREALLYFLANSDVPPTNNASEQGVRTSVIHRKVTNGFRAEWGAQSYAALLTLWATAQQAGQNAFTKLLEICGTPVLPLLEAYSP